MKIHESGRRKGKAPGVCDTSSALERVFGTGVAVGREKHKRLGYVLWIWPDSHNILRFLYFLGLSRTVTSAGNH